MAIAHLEVVARSTPELLERICRVLRHRGATLEHLVFSTADERVRIALSARLRGDPDLMVRQLERLPDVETVCRFNTS
ncbi:MAG: ACT domain-containing protein [Allobranchiibius sp.]|nr:acetolactate synthase 2 small subunit [Actinomycetota bacterium]